MVNYVAAMNYGLERLEKLPISLRLLREIHERLMQGVRGKERNPGEFRSSQNWIGPYGCTLKTATFVPPPPQALMDGLGDLEKFLNFNSAMPELVRLGIVHA